MTAASSSAGGGLGGTVGAGVALAGDGFVGAGFAGDAFGAPVPTEEFAGEISPCGRVGMNNKRGSDVDDAISNFCAWTGCTEPISAAISPATLAVRSERVTLAHARRKAKNARTVFERPQPIAPITKLIRT